MKTTLLFRGKNFHRKPELIIAGYQNYWRMNPSPIDFFASANPVIDTNRKFNLYLTEPVINMSNPT